MVAALARPARAEESPEALIRQGVEMRRRGEDAKAHGYLKRAYELSHTPRAAAQLGFVEQALSYFLDAQGHLAEALAGNDAWVDQQRNVLQDSLTSVRMHLGRVMAHGLPPAATVAVGARPAIDVPSDRAVWVNPGSTTLVFAAAEYRSVTRQVTVAAAESIELVVELPPIQPLVSAAPTTPGESTAASATVPAIHQTATSGGQGDDHGHALRAAGIVTGSAGLAMGIAGGVLYTVGVHKRDAIQDDAANNRPYNPSNGNYQSFGDVGIGLMIGGGAAVVTGTLLYLFSGKTESSPAVSVSYLPGTGGVVRVGGCF
jgi:hypothetical protein